MKVKEFLSGNLNSFFVSLYDLKGRESYDCTANSLRLDDGNNAEWKNATVTSWEVNNRQLAINVVKGD